MAARAPRAQATHTRQIRLAATTSIRELAPARSFNQEFGPAIFDPSCYFDRDTQRWFHLANTFDRIGVSPDFAGTDHLDLAVSQTANPLDGWNIYRIAAQNNGTQGTPDHRCPGRICAADYPHFGADANGSVFHPGRVRSICIRTVIDSS
jgi:hypothetical protein